MVVDTHNKKMLKAVNGNQMNCSGSVTFKVEYEGRKTDVLALASSSIHEEILLNWQTLQRLGIIPKNFPHIGISAKTVIASPKQQLEQAIANHGSVFRNRRPTEDHERRTHAHSPEEGCAHQTVTHL